MKKLALFLIGTAMSLLSYGQTMEKDYYKHVSGDTAKPCVKCSTKSTSFMSGRTIYVYGGVSAMMPPTDYGYSFEAGIWGTTKLTSFAVTADIMKSTQNWFGVKAYLTAYQNSNAAYYLYAAPKVDNALTHGLLEIGFNPCYTMNKHMLMSVTICDQIFNDNNKFDKSIWHPGISVGIVLLK